MATARKSTAVVVVTVCSGCMEPVRLDLEKGTATCSQPLNRTPVSVEVWGDPDLWTWDCPLCDYADSFDPNF
jgi:hypothetical protein